MKRSLTKTLALLLACALLSTAALAFSDDADIGGNYRAAVSAMAEAGVLAGYPDGSFHPSDTLTREQGAKIIAYLRLGKTAAEALKCSKAPFDDVAATRWSAPYIAWCAEQGILHGYGNGKFGPNDPLTGDQYAKMLLCALGLARAGNYANVGGEWYKMVREDARAAKLYTGDASMESGESVNRAQAALLSWNTTQAADAAKQAEPTPSGGGSSGGSSSGGSGGGTVKPKPIPEPTPEPTPTPDEPTPALDPMGDIELPEVP
jgi:hypothetical protein